jgi:hypothetical protein
VSKKRNDLINTRAIQRLANDADHKDGWAKITRQDALLESRETVIFKKPQEWQDPSKVKALHGISKHYCFLTTDKKHQIYSE